MSYIYIGITGKDSELHNTGCRYIIILIFGRILHERRCHSFYYHSVQSVIVQRQIDSGPDQVLSGRMDGATVRTLYEIYITFAAGADMSEFYVDHIY